MSETTNFADAPQTIGEARSDRSHSAADWSPRDLLINLLREIDRGELAPTALVVMYGWPDDRPGVRNVSYSTSSPDTLTTHGLVALVTAKMIREGAHD